MASRTRRARYAKRRANRMAKRDHDLTDQQWNELKQAWGGCAYCGASDGPLQKDTVLAISRGGRYTLSNVVPACRSCNASKCNDEVTGWMRRKKLNEKRFLVRQYEIHRFMTNPPGPASVVAIDSQQPDPLVVGRIGERLRAGGLVALPTETVYGLGCNALDAGAVAKVFAAKGRPASDPLIVHVDSLEMVDDLVDGVVPDLAVALADAFWPGPLTMILPKADRVPDAVTSGGPTVGIRMPAHPVARSLIAAAGVPVAAPSANRFGRISPTRVEHVVAELGDRIDVIVDGGPCRHGVESTVVAVSSDSITVLRHGAVTVDRLREVVPVVDALPVDAAERQAAPGHDVRHYSPGCPTVATITAPSEPFAGRAVFAGYDGPDLPEGWVSHSLGPRDDLIAVAHDLYENLRAIDDEHPDVLVVELTGAAGLGEAIDDRLSRSASGVVAIDEASLVAAIADATS